MNPRSSFIPKDAVFPFQGLNSRDPSTLADPRYGTVCDNVSVQFGTLRKRSGLRPLGDQTALDGYPVLAVIEFATGAGNIVTVACTRAHQYLYDATGDIWVDVTGPGPTLGSAVVWTGTDADPIQWCIATDNFGTWLYITNGVDMPRRWDGATDTFTDIDDGPSFNLTAFDTCKSINVLSGSLVFANITTSGSNQPKSIAWSDTNNFNQWQTGVSGVELLADSDGPVWRLVPLGELMVVYSSNSIGVIKYVGGDVLFAFEILVNRTQLLSPAAIVNLGPVHLFASEENIYLFDGTRLHRSIGDIVQAQYRDDVALDLANGAFAFNDSIETQIYFAIPYSDTISYVYVCDYDLKDLSTIKFVRHSYAGRLTALGYLVRDGVLTWDQLGETTWDDWAGPWDKRSTKGAFPVRAVGTGAGQIFIYDDGNFNDGGVAVEAEWQSIDYVVPGDYVSRMARFVELQLELRGVSVDIAVNVNRNDASSWETVEEGLALTGDWVKYTIPIDFHGEMIRIRLRNFYSGSGFEMRWLRVWLRPGGGY